MAHTASDNTDAPTTGPARDIAVRLSSADKPAVEVRLSERSGEVRVAVRSADPQLAESMRGHLPELVERLGDRGFQSEIWRPPASPAASESGSHPHPESRERGASGREPSDQRGGRDPRDQREHKPAWLEELETSFRPAPKRTGV